MRQLPSKYLRGTTARTRISCNVVPLRADAERGSDPPYRPTDCRTGYSLRTEHTGGRACAAGIVRIRGISRIKTAPQGNDPGVWKW